MTHASLSEARSRLPELVDLAVGGEEIFLTRHGHEVARLSGLSERAPSFPSRADFRARLQAKGLVASKESTVAALRAEDR